MSRPIGDSGISSFSNSPASQESPLGGRAGPGVSRAPLGVFEPPTRGTNPEPDAARIPPPKPLEPDEMPRYGDLALPGNVDDSARGGMTIDQAIELLVDRNLYLAALKYEIPLSDADILTSSLRNNPILYADSQMVPYGRYDRTNVGGPPQYDLNVTFPIDANGKRKARVAVARAAKKVTEAQLQDAVRLSIDNMYTVYVDLLAAQETARFSRAYLDGLDKLLELNESLLAKGQVPESNVDLLKTQRSLATFQVRESDQAVIRSSRILSQALDMERTNDPKIMIDDDLHDQTELGMDEDQLARMALETRPDIAAYRLGVDRAQADIRLAEKEKYADIYLLAQPYTYQDNRPYGLKSPTSWAVGLTVPLPIFNRNQGNIARARFNMDQTKVEYASVERQVLDQVAESVQEFRLSRLAVEDLESEIIPAATRVKDTAMRKFQAGEIDAIDFLQVQRQYNDVIRNYRDALIRHRRSRLEINTAVGTRLLR
jgi:cobalt-zinc-cadmium efflux system outer membrane protein